MNEKKKKGKFIALVTGAALIAITYIGECSGDFEQLL